MKDAKVFFAFKIAKMIYKEYLREILVEKINDPDSEVDDFILGLIDAVFSYEK